MTMPSAERCDPVAEPVAIVEIASASRAEPQPRSIAFRRGRGDLCILDLASGEIRTLRSGWDASLDCVWSPDSQWLAVAVSDRDFNRDVHLIPADGSDAGVAGGGEVL